MIEENLVLRRDQFKKKQKIGKLLKTGKNRANAKAAKYWWRHTMKIKKYYFDI